MDSAHRLHNYEILGTWYGELPEGCKLCVKGSKVVVFVSGFCGIECFYCPISFERKKPNAFYVDEESVRKLSEILDEICFVRAEGASITGGEPFQMYHITTKVINILKNVFGEKFHIHLYTSGFGATKNSIKYLDSLGLDEIRFHIIDDSVMKLVEFTAQETNMSVGIEIPAIPNFNWLWNIVVNAEKSGAKFVNINELEVSETNVDNIVIRGFKINENGKSVQDSAEIAKKIVYKAHEENLNISIHFCPSEYKDFIQHRNRLRRKSWTCSQPTDIVNDDGTIRRDNIDLIPLMKLCSDYIERRLD